MGERRPKRCSVVFATPERQFEWHVQLEEDADVASALEQARVLADDARIPWETCDLGIFGEPCARNAVPRDGDRIEIYRPLACDPKQARRERARRARSGGRSGT